MTKDVYKSRQDSLRNYLEEKNIDTAMVMSPVNINYFRTLFCCQ